MEIINALYLIPVPISDAPAADVLPEAVGTAISHIRHYIVENVRTARRFIKRIDRNADIGAMTFHELNGHTDPEDIPSMLDALRKGEPMGVMSEAGCPGVADPGSQVVEIAQREGLRVIPLAGPSSILMSLMASGFNGQGFAFNGYLPIDHEARRRKIRELETLAGKGMTQIFIETPYRNNKLIAMLAETLRPGTKLCVASGITDPERESIITLPANKWATRRYDYAKTPAIFLIYK